MSQYLTMPAAESDHPSSIPGSHMVEEKRTSSHKLSSDLYICTIAYTHARIYTQNKYKKFFKDLF